MESAGFWGDLTPATATRELNLAGFALDAGGIRLEAREDRWAALFPPDRIAWFPANREGDRRLAIERNVLRLLAERCSFAVPRILAVAPGGFDVRTLVPGVSDPERLYRRALTDADFARRTGSAIGSILAEQHSRIREADVAGWLPRQVSWPPARVWCRERLPRVVAEASLLERIEVAWSAYESVSVEPADCVLVHADLGLHNIAVDATSGDVAGIFDYDSAAWTDRHHDFRYLLFHERDDTALEAAIAAYEPAIGRRLDRFRIRLYNAACAIGYLAFRAGTAPDEKSCGRTLAEDLAWTSSALSGIGL